MSEVLFPGFERNGTPVLQVEGLSIGYERPIVEALSFNLRAGSTLALVGGNGSGKTTLLKTLSGLIPPLAGSVAIFGQAPRFASRHIAWLGQFHPSNPLLPLRVLELVNMAQFPRLGLTGRFSALDVEVTNAALRFVGLEALAKKPLGALSGGQRQKVFLAYALARRAPLVFLDEAIQNLDAEGNDVLARAVSSWQSAGAAILTATHDEHEAGACDMVLHFLPGTTRLESSAGAV